MSRSMWVPFIQKPTFAPSGNANSMPRPSRLRRPDRPMPYSFSVGTSIGRSMRA